MNLIYNLLKIEKHYFKKIFKISPNKRRFLIFIIDHLAIFLALIFTFLFFKSISKDELIKNFRLLSIITFSISSIVYLTTKQYSSITRYIGSKSVFKIFSRNLLIYFLIYILNLKFNFLENSLNVLITIFSFSTFFISSYRFVILDLILYLNHEINKIIKMQ